MAGQELTLGGFSTKTSDPSKARASQDNVHLAASLLSVETAGISSRQHIMYMYTCHRLTGTSIDSKQFIVLSKGLRESTKC